MNTIDSSLFLANQKTTRDPSPTLGKDGFLQILMTQLQNQDPSQPMDTNAMVEQLTSFTMVEQIMNMSNSIDTLVESQLISPVIEYSHMIGKEVTYESTEADTGEKSSKVLSVSQREGWAILELENGETVYADAVTKVSVPEKA
ncbi:flagellar hook assembly protein FlgD [Oceanobacillus piezotolerans]|uniref:Flagellar hook assembly protein FlgD n=1 Tax=Oceanobacillus piezotolerans TaxID=2448030 RepID=A0A498DBC3_9BACI|nr:flagellar hook assembly protein FlgD [Oceanobacillus piezotolerans]RLL45320.1 flagellar hook assembly protein FlgD [Oceanobacillus piezotolerans]